LRHQRHDALLLCPSVLGRQAELLVAEEDQLRTVLHVEQRIYQLRQQLHTIWRHQRQNVSTISPEAKCRLQGNAYFESRCLSADAKRLINRRMISACAESWVPAAIGSCCSLRQWCARTARVRM
jgi:hypothetical protein